MNDPTPSPRPTPSQPVPDGPNQPRPPVPIGTGLGRGEPIKTPSPVPQHWTCGQCPTHYVSAIPLKHPPAHQCRTRSGRLGLVNLTLEEQATTP